jgi:NADH-quinone oxidoreductase subunit L
MIALIPWLILFLPLAAAAAITLFFQRNGRLSAAISVGAVAVSFVLSAILLAKFLGGHVPEMSLTWLQTGRLNIEFGMRVDLLSVLMLLVVCGVGAAIHIYSIGYMHGDPGFARFFASMSLFTFSMLGIVLSNNFFQMFVFWELVGMCSYLLIGFWYQRASAADAAKKAFLANRVGDFGFFAGILLAWAVAGTLNFAELQDKLAQHPDLFGSAATVAGLLIFCGAVGKSAQFPLHVWLPDAMEGPTPVSALIHAATMVAAGVYMLCRVFFIFGGTSLEVIAWIGGITALLSALIAVQQDDIKRILAYSTLSQLGYMVMAVGFNAPAAAMYHLTTHAFFKALLFLGAGSVIHALSQEQNIWRMGRLREKMPVTHWTFLAGTLALCGLWPLSGFFSKDAILGAAWACNRPLFFLGAFVAFLTTFYMFRLFFVVFLGKAKSELPEHAHESPAVMTYPLVFLAAASVAGGFFGIEGFITPQFTHETAPAPLEIRAVVIGLAAFALGLWAAYASYAGATSDPLPAKMPGTCRVLRNKFYFDEFYAVLIELFQDRPARVVNIGDAGIRLLVRLAHGTTEWTGRVLRLFQTGNLQTYSLLTAFGMALVLYLMFRS